MTYKLPINYIAGEGYGVSYSSKVRSGNIAWQVRQFGQMGIQPVVNIFNQNLVLFDRKISLYEFALPLDIYAVYNSLATTRENAWQFSVAKRMLKVPSFPDGVQATVCEADGHITVFNKGSKQGNLCWLPQTLAAGDPYMVRDEKQKMWAIYYPGRKLRELYNDNGQLIFVINAAGQRLTYAYDNDGKIQTITGPGGAIYRFVYKANSDKSSVISLTATDPEKKTTNKLLNEYHFDALGRLSQSVAPGGYKTNYSYFAESYLLTMVTQTDKTQMVFQYEGSGAQSKLNNIITGNFSQSISKSDNEVVIKNIGGGMLLTVTLDDQGVVQTVSQSRGYVTRPQQLAAYVNKYNYNADNRLTSITHWDNSQTSLTYTGKDIIMLASKAFPSGKKEEYYYNNELLRYVTSKVVTGSDKKIYAYRYVYDYLNEAVDDKNLLLRFSLSPRGVVTEYRYNQDTGLLINQRVYLKAVFDLSDIPPQNSLAMLTMQNWIAKQDPIKVALSTYSYDIHGQLTTVKKYLNVNSQGVGVDDEFVAVTKTNYDEQHHLLSQDVQYTAKYAFHREWTYDGLERETQQKIIFEQSDTVTTTHEYNDESSIIKTSSANNKTQQQLYNQYGVVYETSWQGSSNQQQQTRTVHGYCGPLQRIVTTVQTDAQSSYTFYDQQNHLGYTVSNTGFVKSSQQDLAHRATTNIHYAKAISIDALFLNMPHTDPNITPQAETLQDLLQKQGPSADNRTTYQFTDIAGNLYCEIDASQYIVEHRYNLRGLKIATIRYESPASTAEITALQTGASLSRQPDASKDRYSRWFYDDDGNLLAKQNPAGYLTEYTLDLLGNITAEVRYATPASFTADFPANKPTASADDSHYYYFRNNRGQIICEVDPNNFVTAFTYYANGLKQSEHHYYTPLIASWDHRALPAMPAANSEDKTLTFAYDEFSRCISRVDPYGLSNAKKYDKMGNLLIDRNYDAAHIKDPFDNTDIQLADADKCRTRQTQYDAWNQVVRGANRRVGALLAAIMTNSKLTPAEKEQQVADVWANQSSRYTYDQSGLKLSATNSLDEMTQYFYDSERRLVLVVDPLGAATQHTYNAFNEKITTHQYYNLIDLAQLPKTRTTGFISAEIIKLLKADAHHDIVDTFAYDANGNLQSHTNAEGYVTQYTYNAWGEMATKHLCVNDKQPDLMITYQYDARGNRISEAKKSGSKTITTQQTFTNLHNKVASKTDALGYVTLYTYDQRGNVLTITDPQKIIQHQYTYDAYQRVLQDKTPSGTQLHSYDQRTLQHIITHPISGTKTVVSSNAFAEPTKIQDALGVKNNYAKIKTYDAGGDVASSTDELGHTFVFTRNTEGRLLAKQHPALSYDAKQRLDQSSYNASGHLVALKNDANGLAYKHLYTVNTFGRNERLTTPRGIFTVNTFSLCGNLLQATHDYGTSTVPGLRQTETYTYNAQKQKITYTQGDSKNTNQYAVNFSVDGFNRNLGKTVDPTALNIHEQNVLNDNAQVIKHTDPRGNIFYLFYDNCQRLRFKVNADCSVFEVGYNPNGSVRLKRTYEQRVPAGKIDETTSYADVVTLMSSLISSEDTQDYHYYNANDQLQFTVSVVDGKGIIKENLYDLASRNVGQVGYATLMTADFSKATTADIVTLVNDSKNQSKDDRKLHFVLDAAGQKRFAFQPDGSVIESQFDAYGHCIAEIDYAAFVPDPSAYLTKKPEDIKIPANPAEPNHITYHVYDVFNRPQFTIIGTSVIGYTHDAHGNLIQECHYHDAIKLPAQYSDLVKLCRALKPDRSKDKVKDTIFDHLNHVITVVDPMGAKDIYQRDALGNEVLHTDRNGAKWQFSYDKAKRQISKTLPEITIPTVATDKSTGKLSLSGESKITPVDKTEYDKANNVIAVTKNAGQPDQRQVAMQYSAMNHISAMVVANVTVDDRTKPANMNTLPTKVIATLTQKFVSNTKGKVVAIQAMNGAWQFDVYDAAKRLVFKLKQRDDKFFVTQYIRNAFGEQLQLIHYNNPLSLDVTKYINTGVPLSVVTANLKPDATHDQAKAFVRSQRGHVQEIFESPVLWYMPDKLAPKVGLDKPHSQYRDDTRGKRILIRRQRFPGHPELDYIKRKWWDDHGNLLAEAEATQLVLKEGSYVNSPVTYKVKVYNYNAKQEPVSIAEWAIPISKMPDETMSLSTLMSLHQSSADDRVHEFTHDLCSRLTAENLRDVAYYDVLAVIAQKMPQVVKKPTTTASTTYTYNAVGLRTSEKNAKGVSTYTYYDAQHRVVVKTGEPFTTQDASGKSITMTPLQFFYHNAFGQKVAETMFAQGANPLSNPASIPTPRDATDPDNTTHILLYDNRGSVYKEQNPAGTQTVKLYDVMRNVSRQYSTLNNYDPTYDPSDKTKLVGAEKKIHIDETQTDRDSAGNLKQQVKLRDGKVEQTTMQTVNAFAALATVGDTSDPQAVTTHYNQAGHSYITNNNKQGVYTLELSDLTHRGVGFVTSPVADLSTLSVADALKLMQDESKRSILNVTSHFINQQGNLLREALPDVNCYEGDAAVQVLVPLSFLYDKEKKTVSISWNLQGSASFTSTINLYPAGDPETPFIFKATSDNDEYTVTISSADLQKMPTDFYEYKISFQAPSLPLYEANGQCAIDTGNDKGSLRVIALVDTPATVNLLGNTAGLSTVSLFQDDKLVGDYPVKAAPSGRGFTLDLQSAKAASGDPLPSGTYTIQATKARQVDQHKTLPFVIYTKTPAPLHHPLPRTTEYSAQLLFYDQLGQLILSNNTGDAFDGEEFILAVEYTSVSATHVSESIKVKYGQSLANGHFVDLNNQEIQANFTFSQAVQSIDSMTLSLMLNASTEQQFELYRQAKPVTDEWQLIDDFAQDDDWQAVSTDGKKIASSLVQVAQFALGKMTKIYPLTKDELDKIVFLRLFCSNLTFGLNFIWFTPTLGDDNALIDTTHISNGLYFWDFWGPKEQDIVYDNMLNTSLIGVSYASDRGNHIITKVVSPAKDYALDVWSNKVSITDGLGAVTQQVFDKRNKRLQVKHPPVPMIDDNGVYHGDDDMQVTTRQTYRDIMGERIAFEDERKMVKATLRDEAGNEKKIVLADGTSPRTVLSYNGFTKMQRYADTTGNVWQQTFNPLHQVKSVTTPMGYKTTYLLNERGETLLVTDPANNTVTYGYGIYEGWLTLKKMPSGQIQAMTYHRGDVVQSTVYGAVAGDPLGQLSVNHHVDFFGVKLQSTLMDGSTVTYTLDKEKRTILTSSVSKARTYRILKTTFDSNSNPIYALSPEMAVPNQKLIQYWSGGVLVREVDAAEQKESYYGYDANLRRVLHDGTDNLQGHFSKRADLDARGNIVKLRDDSTTFIIQYSATALPRRQIGEYFNVFSRKEEIQIDIGNTYDAVGRPLIQGGVWNTVTKAPILSNGQGSQFTYDPQTGLRQTEQSIANGKLIKAAITVDKDMRVDATVETDPTGKSILVTNRYYTPVALEQYAETGGNYSLKRFPTVDADGRVSANDTLCRYLSNMHLNEQKSKTTAYNNQSAAVTINSQFISYNADGSANSTNTSITNSYAAFEDQQLISVAAKTHDQGGDKYIAPAHQYYDSSRRMISRSNVDTGYNGDTIFDEAYSVTTDGLMTRALYFSQNLRYQFCIFKVNFHTPDGNLFASYNNQVDPRAALQPGASIADSNTTQLRFHQTPRVLDLHGGVAAVVRGGAVAKGLSQMPASSYADDSRFQIVEGTERIVDKPTPETLFDFMVETGQKREAYGNYIPAPASNYPPATQRSYCPEQPMTAAQIAKIVYGSASEADMISQANGGKPDGYTFPVGFNVIIPDLQLSSFTADRSVDLARIMRLFEGSLQPHISFAPIKHHESCGEKIIHVVIDVISTLVALSAPGPLTAALHAALLDLSLQMLAKAVHLIQYFSWADVVDTALSAGLMQAMGNPTHALFQFADTGSYAASLTADAVFKLAAEQASINLATQLTNIALGFQTSLSVRSVFDTMLTTVFDIGIQGLAPIPTYADTLGARLSLSLVHATENLIESYAADAITGTSTHLDDMIAQAIGVALSTAITTPGKTQVLKNIADQKAKQVKHPRHQHAAAQAQQIHTQHSHYLAAHYAAKGGTRGNIALPNSSTWQQQQAANMNDLSNSSNHPATSTQQVRQQLQTTADHYHQAIQQHSTLADLVRTAFNEADYAATTSQQAPSVPTHVHTVMQGGSPTATPSGVVSSVLHGIVAGLEDAGDDAIHMAHNVIQHVLAYDHAMNDPVHLARYVEQSALLGSAALNQAAGTATSIANAIEHPSILMKAVEHSITGFMHEPLATQVEDVTHWGVSFFGPAAALKGAAVLGRSSGFFTGQQEVDVVTHLSPNELEVTHPRTMGRKAFGRLVQHIKENGISETVKYIEYNDKNYVVDGNHRLAAARALGLDKIPVERVGLPYLGYKSVEDLDFYSPGFSNK